MTRSMLVLLIAATLTGCGDRSEPATTPAQSAPSGQPVDSAAPEPAPFETIPLASDASYESPPATDGAQPGEVREFTNLKIKFCWCPPGDFEMGSSETSSDHQLNESQHKVTLSRGFWMQQTELTQNQYQQLMGSNPAFYKGEQNPVDSVTWNEANEFARRLSELPPEKKAGNLFRLPTEAEWEYACRAGSTTVFTHGDDEAGLEEFAWYHKNSARTTHPVGKKKPNGWGLHDMHGNVSEWCQDFYGDHSREAAIDPRGPPSGDKRTLRGGGWFQVAMWQRSSHRDAFVPSARYVGLGFRLVATMRTPSDERPQAE
ncbi:MAG TPA: SUMF1/EgtB/PvdO family nonheme iron enzyme [Planctomycetaceae bacterium]|nr:SUMF1/EgtB/PvdO family nonheme iron enzyme [Planctomycetaceae bacterium]